MKLYMSKGACSLSAHIALREAGLPFELVQVNLKTKLMANGEDFLAVNAKGYVPVLELDDGQKLTEAPAVLQYIADLNPQAKLAAPSGTMERYHLQEWLSFISSEIHKQFFPLFHPKETSEDQRHSAREMLAKRFGWVAGQLEKKTYLIGDDLSVADILLFNMLRWTRETKVDLSLWPGLASYEERIRERPMVQSALEAEAAMGKSPQTRSLQPQGSAT